MGSQPLIARLMLFLAALVCTVPSARATAYAFPGSLPLGCTGTGPSYICSSSVTLNSADTVAINSPKPATITIAGGLTVNGAKINNAGIAADLTLLLSGTLSATAGAVINANVTAGNVGSSGAVSYGGSVTTTGSGYINIDAGSNVTGAVTTSTGAVLLFSGTAVNYTTVGSINSGGGVTLNAYNSVLGNTTGDWISSAGHNSYGGNLTATTYYVSLGGYATVSGSITAQTYVDTGSYSSVVGSITANTSYVALTGNTTVGGSITSNAYVDTGNTSSVTGSITTTGGSGTYIDIHGNTTVGGALTAKSYISMVSGSTVGGDMLAGTTIFMGSGSSATSSCLRSTSSNSIFIPSASSVGGACCGTAPTCTNTCVTSTPKPPACSSGVASFTVVPASTTPSTCSPVTITITARTSAPATYTGYTGTINLSTSTGKGDWALGGTPTPSGSLNNGVTNDGAATYTYASGDSGVVKLTLTNTQANSLTVTVVDSAVAGSSTTSSTLTFSDNAFTLAEDLSNQIAGTEVVVAGRNHDFQVTAVKKDPSTGACGTATSYIGTKSLKMWRTDSGSTWTAPTVVLPALTIPSSTPGASNLSLVFANGVATFNLGTTDIGRYSLSVRDATGSFASGNIDGSTGTLTVRPFSVVVSGISQGATNNPNGSAYNDTVFAKAGSSFQATVAGYRWSATADTNVAGGDGVPDGSATLAQATAGGVAPSFASTVTLSPMAASQTPATGVLGSLSNGTVSSFSSGSSTPTTLQYSEVGSFLLNTNGVVSNFIGSGLSLDATVFNATGSQNARVGRFKPAQFNLSAQSVTHRSALACSPASAFTYQGELFQLGFTLTAQNASNATTANYTGTFAKLDLSTPTNFALIGLAGTQPLRTTGGTPRLSLGTSSGSWSNGVATGITLAALVTRASAAEALSSASLGVAPQDSDGTLLSSYDLDSSYPADSTDAGLIGTLDIRFGRLRLSPAIGPQDRDLPLPLAAQYWNGLAFVTNTLDSCTAIASTAVNFGQYRRTITAADTSVKSSPVTLSSGTATLWLNKPAAGHAGTYDVTLSLGSAATDASCLSSLGSGAGDSATVGANLAHLRGAWCGATYDKDPSARATFGLFRGSQNVIHQQENY